MKKWSGMGVQYSGTLRGWYEIQRSDTILVEINDCKIISMFDKAGNDQTAKLSKTVILEIVLSCSNVAPSLTGHYKTSICLYLH